MNKVVRNAREAIADLHDGAVIMSGGFGVCGVPEDLLNATCEKGVKNLTIISNNAGIDGLGVGVLLAARQIRKMISTYVGENLLFEKLALAGELEMELVPQGTFSERIRAGERVLPAFLHRPGTALSSPRGRKYGNMTAGCMSSSVL